MHPLLKKLNYKGESVIHIINLPEIQTDFLDSLNDVQIINSAGGHADVPFALLFAITQDELNSGINSLGPRLVGDATLWVCYPKKSSKKYTCEFNRDTGWDEFGKFDLEGVRQVAIDEDWSALRFRKIDFIKNFKRDPKRALSNKGKKRSNNDRT